MPLDTGTTELVLPGLDVSEPAADPKPGHWIERGPQKRLMVFSGRSHPELAKRIDAALDILDAAANALAAMGDTEEGLVPTSDFDIGKVPVQ